jgi:hypothetical protein
MQDMAEAKLKIQVLTDKSNFMRETIEEHELRINTQTETIMRQTERINQLESTVTIFQAKIHLFDEMQKRMKVGRGQCVPASTLWARILWQVDRPCSSGVLTQRYRKWRSASQSRQRRWKSRRTSMRGWRLR